MFISESLSIYFVHNTHNSIINNETLNAFAAHNFIECNIFILPIDPLLTVCTTIGHRNID